MRALFSSLGSIAPFLFGERPALALTKSLREVRSHSTQVTSFGEQLEQSGLRIEGTHQDLSLDGVHLSACDFSGARFKSLSLIGGHLSRSHLCGTQIEGAEAKGSTWSILDLEAAHITDLRAETSHFALLSLRDSRLCSCSLKGSAMTLCDLSGAHLENVDLSMTKLEGCDFTGAVLSEVNLSKADLRSAVFAETWLNNVDLEGALVQGADFRRAGGLSTEQRNALQARGARTGGGHVYRFWHYLLARKSGQAPHKRVLLAVAITWATLALLVPSVFFLRAIIDPVDPEAPPSYEVE